MSAPTGPAVQPRGRRFQPLRGHRRIRLLACGHLVHQHPGHRRQPDGAACAIHQPLQTDRPQVPHVPPGLCRPLHRCVSAHDRRRGSQDTRALQSARYRVANWSGMRDCRVSISVWWRTIHLYALYHYRWALAHDHTCSPSGTPSGTEARFFDNGHRMGALSRNGSPPLNGCQQLQQSQHVLADGHRDAFIPSLHYTPPAVQCWSFPGDLRLLRVHLHCRSQPRVPRPRRRHQDSQTHGCADLHRLSVHGAHFVFRHLSGLQSPVNHGDQL